MTDSIQQVTRLKGGWLEARSAEGYVLARHWPPRFDVSARAELPLLRPGRLARQIRQDLWRTLQNLRGFSPAVQICFTSGGMDVTVGGRVYGRIPQGTGDRIRSVLDDPDNRSRWISWARRPS